jgi:hypothetical protein
MNKTTMKSAIYERLVFISTSAASIAQLQRTGKHSL